MRPIKIIVLTNIDKHNGKECLKCASTKNWLSIRTKFIICEMM